MTPVLTIRKRPETTTAMRFTGANAADVIAWVIATGGEAYEAEGHLYLVTDRDDTIVDAGDTVIRGLVGEFYPCTPEAYAAGWEEL